MRLDNGITLDYDKTLKLWLLKGYFEGTLLSFPTKTEGVEFYKDKKRSAEKKRIESRLIPRWNQLTDREKMVYCAINGVINHQKCTVKEVAKVFALSTTRIRQICKDADYKINAST